MMSRHTILNGEPMSGEIIQINKEVHQELDQEVGARERRENTDLLQ